MQLQRANATSPRIASRTTTTQRIAQYNDSAAHRANTTSPQRSAHRSIQRLRSASRKYNQSAEVRVSHPVQRPRIALRGPRIALVSFRLVRGTIFSKIQYIYIFIPEHFMTHPSYWLRCENLICGPRFDSGTRRVIVVGPRRRPCCNDDRSPQQNRSRAEEVRCKVSTTSYQAGTPLSSLSTRIVHIVQCQ